MTTTTMDDADPATMWMGDKIWYLVFFFSPLMFGLTQEETPTYDEWTGFSFSRNNVPRGKRSQIKFAVSDTLLIAALTWKLESLTAIN